MSDDLMDKLEKTHVVIIHETVAESWGRDFGTFCLIVGFWSLGYFTDSGGLQWLGVIMALFVTALRILAMTSKRMKSRMTPDEARAWLDREFPRK